jgi:hypothetical protein
MAKKTKKSVSLVKPQQPKSHKHLDGKLRQARILLRKVDAVLKTDGIEAALKTLMQVRLEIPLNPTIRMWLRDYRDMLDAWHSELMSEVLDEFKEYGCRRARDLTHRCLVAITQQRLAAYYLACERVFEQMAERKRLSIIDTEEQLPEEEPKMVSLDEVSEDQLERGTKY